MKIKKETPKGMGVPVEPRLLNIRATAAYTGATIWQVRTWAWQRLVPFVQFGNRILFDKADLDLWIESQKVRAA